eukprot:1679523-Heterocapsa_arctica.AAC.1
MFITRRQAYANARPERACLCVCVAALQLTWCLLPAASILRIGHVPFQLRMSRIVPLLLLSPPSLLFPWVSGAHVAFLAP